MTEEEMFKKAREMTLEDLPTFIKELTEMDHDYNTVVYAMAAGAVATCWAMNKVLNITGFQAGCVFWTFYKHWLSESGPARLIKYDEMLYPQNEEKFQRVISSETWKFLQEEARKKLSEPDDEFLHSAVKAHWEEIVTGRVPFGYSVK